MRWQLLAQAGGQKASITSMVGPHYFGRNFAIRAMVRAKVRAMAATAMAAASLLTGGVGAPAADLVPKPQIVTNVSYPDAMLTDFSADGRYILTGNSRGTVRLWEAASGRLVRTYIAQSTDDREYVDGMGYSPKLDVVVSNDRYGEISIWKASTGQLMRTIHPTNNNGDDPQRLFAFTADGKRMVSANQYGDGGTIKIWDTTTWRVVRTLAVPKGEATFSPDGLLALINGDTDLTLVDLATGRKLWTAAATAISVVAFSPDGSRIATDSGPAKLPYGQLNPSKSQQDPQQKPQQADGTVVILDAKTGKPLATLQFRTQSPDVASLAFAAAGAAIVAASADGSVRTWDAQTGRLIATISKPDLAKDLTLSPNGDHALSTNADGDSAIWNPQTGEAVGKLGLTVGPAGLVEFVAPAARSPAATNGAAAILAGNINFDDNTAAVHRWDASTGRLLGTVALNGMTWNNYAPGFVFSSDGTFAVSGTAEPPSSGDDKPATPTQPAVTIWNLTTGAATATLPGQPQGATVAVSLDGKFVFSIDGDGGAMLWNRAAARAVWTTTFDSAANCATISVKGDRIAFGGSDGITIVDAATGKLLRFLKEDGKYGISSLAFSPDGHRLIEGNGDWEDNASIWDADNGKRLHTLSGHAKVVSSVAFSPDGKHVLTGGQDGTARIWNAATGAQERVLHLDSASPFQSVTFSADGAQVISGHADGSTAIWNSTSGALVVTLIAAADGEWVAITPEGFFDASANGSKLLHVVSGVDVISIDQVFQNLYRPDLVREKLAGDPQGKVGAAAATLDLAKVLASGAPPLIRIVTPQTGTAAAQDQVTVKAELTPRDGGIGRIEWRVNGVTRGIESNAPPPSAGAPVQLERTFALEQGANTIEIVAYNAKGLLASAPARTLTRWDGVTGAAPPRLYVFAVGINDYWDSRLRLNYAAPDAQSLTAALKLAGRNLFPVINVATALNEDANRANIGAVFDKLAKDMKPSDVFVFFIVGHGATIDGRYYFLPYDFRYDDDNSVRDRAINQDQLQAWFAEIPAKKSMLIFDTCESGSMTEDVVATRGLEHLVALERLTQAMGRTVLSASTATAPALEGYHNHGVYTYALLEALDKADANGDGLITVTEIAEYLANRVPDLSYQAFNFRQVPQMKIIGSSFPIAKPTDVLDKDAVAAAPPLSTIPTHVVTRSIDVLSAPSGGAAVRTLSAGTTVSIVLTDHGWDLIAKDGMQLGYVPADGLARLQ
jgi:WD40 repeat protein